MAGLEITLGQGLQETLEWVDKNLTTLKTLPWNYQHKTETARYWWLRIQGSVLVPLLLADGHSVTSVDTQWFGNALPEHPQLTNLKLDVRNIDEIPLDGVDAVIHLANIANDPAVELKPNPELGSECARRSATR